MSEIIEGPYSCGKERGYIHDCFYSVFKRGADGLMKTYLTKVLEVDARIIVEELNKQWSLQEARVKELEEVLDLVIPRCVICFAYATKFNPKKLWPVCDDHILDAGGATQLIDYRNAIKATEALKKLRG